MEKNSFVYFLTISLHLLELPQKVGVPEFNGLLSSRVSSFEVLLIIYHYARLNITTQYVKPCQAIAQQD